MTERTFPITLDDQIRLIPWDLIAPHEAQARANHSGKGLEQLAIRGGVTVPEALAIIEDRPWERMPLGAATRQLQALLSPHVVTVDDAQVVALRAALPDPDTRADVLRLIDRAFGVAHRIRTAAATKHAANELIATLEGLRILLEGRQ
jgi:hypothetical protein